MSHSLCLLLSQELSSENSLFHRYFSFNLKVRGCRDRFAIIIVIDNCIVLFSHPMQVWATYARSHISEYQHHVELRTFES